MSFNVANALTMTRLLLAPVFVAAFFAGHHKLAFVLFCFAGFTDLIDGTVARLLKQPSKSGALLDPLADKLLMQGCFVSLLIAGLLPWWFFVLALARDIMIVSGIIYLERIKAELPYRPVLTSKLATLTQLAVAVLGLLRWWRPDLSSLDVYQFAAIIISTVLIVASGAQYMQIGFQVLRRSAGRIPRDAKS